MRIDRYLSRLVWRHPRIVRTLFVIYFISIFVIAEYFDLSY